MTAMAIFRRMIEALEQLGIPYMLAGSYASSVHGVTRATQDFDLVVAPTRDQLLRLVALFPLPHYYADEGAALEALQFQGQFNILDLATGWKVDLIIRKSRPFSEAEFDRRTTVVSGGLALTVATVEDLVVSKLEWAKLSDSDRQIEDVAGLLRQHHATVDRSYIGHWVEALGLTHQWRLATSRAGVPI